MDGWVGGGVLLTYQPVCVNATERGALQKVTADYWGPFIDFAFLQVSFKTDF